MAEMSWGEGDNSTRIHTDSHGFFLGFGGWLLPQKITAFSMSHFLWSFDFYLEELKNV